MATLEVRLVSTAGVFQDSAGSTAVSADGDGVQRWEDQSGNGNHCNQTSSGNKATYQTNELNGLPAIRFDGSTSYLSSVTNLTLGASKTIYVVARRSSGTGYRRLISCENYWYCGTDSNTVPGMFFGNGAGWSAVYNPARNTGQAPDMTADRAMIVWGSNNGSRRLTGVDNEVEWYESPHAASSHTAAWAVGAQAGGVAQFFNGDVFEIRVYDGEHTPAERKAVLEELLGTYDLGWIPPTLTAHPDNPLVSQGAASSWEDVDVANPDVFYDTASGEYVMNYSGYDGAEWHTGVATASDPGGPWTKSGNNPVLSPSDLSVSYIAANGSIVEKSGTYYLFVQGQSSPRIYAASASTPDGTYSALNGGSAVLTVGSAGQFDETGVADPWVRLLDDGVTFEMIYTGIGTGGRGIGRATSTDGVSWTKSGRLFQYPSWTSQVGFGEPARIDDDFFIYDAVPPGSATTSRALFYGRYDGTYYRHYRALEPSGSGWDSEQVFDASPMLVGQRIYLFHAGSTIAGDAENLDANIGLSYQASAAGRRRRFMTGAR